VAAGGLSERLGLTADALIDDLAGT